MDFDSNNIIDKIENNTNSCSSSSYSSCHSSLLPPARRRGVGNRKVGGSGGDGRGVLIGSQQQQQQQARNHHQEHHGYHGHHNNRFIYGWLYFLFPSLYNNYQKRSNNNNNNRINNINNNNRLMMTMAMFMNHRRRNNIKDKNIDGYCCVGVGSSSSSGNKQRAVDIMKLVFLLSSSILVTTFYSGFHFYNHGKRVTNKGENTDDQVDDDEEVVDVRLRRPVFYFDDSDNDSDDDNNNNNNEEDYDETYGIYAMEIIETFNCYDLLMNVTIAATTTETETTETTTSSSRNSHLEEEKDKRSVQVSSITNDYATKTSRRLSSSSSSITATVYGSRYMHNSKKIGQETNAAATQTNGNKPMNVVENEDTNADTDADEDEDIDDAFVAMEEEEISVEPTGVHLFCIAAMYASNTMNDNMQYINPWLSKLTCARDMMIHNNMNIDDIMDNKEEEEEKEKKEKKLQRQKRRRKKLLSSQLQRSLLDLWGTANAEISTIDTIKSVLNVAVETERFLVGHTVNLWSPKDDEGLVYMLNELNDGFDDYDNNNDIRNSNDDADGTLAVSREINDDDNALLGYNDNDNTDTTPLLYDIQQSQLGNNKLFVDIGSGIGLTSISIALLYPYTKIISIEAASPNWLLQNMNWICNDHVINNMATAASTAAINAESEPTRSRTSIQLAGIGSSKNHITSTNLLWRPTSTTSTRGWTPSKERNIQQDIELKSKLIPFRQILSQSGLITESPPPATISSSSYPLLRKGQKQQQQQLLPNIDVLHIDCEGCEYNLMEQLSDNEYTTSISTIVGNLHWGYIPNERKPSSKRAHLTHRKLCIHKNIAANSIECCEYPTLNIISTTGNDDDSAKDSNNTTTTSTTTTSATTRTATPTLTVRDVAGSLCNNFPQWAKDNKLYHIMNDWGWFQRKGTAD